MYDYLNYISKKMICFTTLFSSFERELYSVPKIDFFY